MAGALVEATMPDDNLYPKDFPGSARSKVEVARDEAGKRLDKALAMAPRSGLTTHESDKGAFWNYIFDVVLGFGQAACELGRDPISQGKWPAYRIRTDVDKFFSEFAHEAYNERGRDRTGRRFRGLSEYTDSGPRHWGDSTSELELLKVVFREVSEQGPQYEAERQALARHQAALAESAEISEQEALIRQGVLCDPAFIKWLETQMKALGITSPHQISKAGGPRPETINSVLRGSNYRKSTRDRLVNTINRLRAEKGLPQAYPNKT
jgi:hypothetical protein